MSLKLVKRKLKRKGEKIYNRYFFNPESVINEIVDSLDNSVPINENICKVIFDIKNSSMEQIYELIRYFPNLLKENRIITDNIIDKIYSEYGETIEILKEHKSNHIRSKLYGSANTRAKEFNLPFNIISEDIKLIKICPLLKIPLEYGNTKIEKYSASLDKIDPQKGYVKGNIQVISMLANQMKSSANKEELIIFSKNILNFYSST